MSIPEEVLPFVKTHYGAWDIFPLNSGGSAREYFRIEKDQESKIICKNKCIYENLRFIELAKILEQNGVPVPSVENISQDQTIYAQNDLGKTTLLNFRQTHRENSISYYKKAIEYLAKMQENFPVDKLKENPFFEPEFDETLIYRDLFYFKHFFLEQVDVNINNAKIFKAFKNILDYSTLFSRNFVMLRDFHGRNIMIHNNETYFIDFQNAMRGYRMYDVVSLLWQAKAQLTAKEKNEVLAHYFSQKNTQEQNHLKEEYELCTLLRGMQVLGAYGKLGLIQKKTHFIESISFGLKNLKQIAQFEIMQKFPYLKEIFDKLETIYTKNQLC